MDTSTTPHSIALTICKDCAGGGEGQFKLDIEGEFPGCSPESIWCCTPVDGLVLQAIYTFDGPHLRVAAETTPGAGLPETLTREHQFAAAPNYYCVDEAIEGEIDCEAGGVTDPELSGEWRQGCEDDGAGGSYERVLTFDAGGTFSDYRIEFPSGIINEIRGTYAVDAEYVPRRIEMRVCETCDGPEAESCEAGNGGIIHGRYTFADGQLRMMTDRDTPNYYASPSFKAVHRYAAAPESYCPIVPPEGEFECPAGGAADPALLGEWRKGCETTQRITFLGTVTWTTDTSVTFRDDGTFTLDNITDLLGVERTETTGTYTVDTSVTPHAIDLNFCTVCNEEDWEPGPWCGNCCDEPDDAKTVRLGVYDFAHGYLRLSFSDTGTRPDTLTKIHVWAPAPDTVCPRDYVEPVEGEIEAEEGEGEGEGEGGPALQMLSADWDGVEGVISLTELLRVIQFYNANGFACADVEDDTEDGFVPGPGDARDCPPHTSDYIGGDWLISLSELLRLIQIFNAGGYEYCPEAGTDDGFCPVAR